MITLKFDDGGLSVNLAQAPQVIGLQLQKWADRVVKHLHAAVARNITDGGLIGRRTGNLARALTELVTVTPDGIIAELWPDRGKAPYGAIQEEGGTIVPKTARALTVPLDAMLTANGVARGTARQVKDDPGAFGFTGTFILKVRDLIMGKQADGDIVPLFALKQSVAIVGRHYLATTLIQEWNWIADELERTTNEIVHVTFGEGAYGR